MSDYVLPQAQVFQEFALAAEVDIRDLNAFITGPHACLYRYSQSDEKLKVLLGGYNNQADTCFDWPNKPAGSIIDEDYTKLYIDNALLRYHHDQTDTLIKTASNKVRSPTTSWKANPANPTTYPRSVSLLDRDVKVGDVVRISGVAGSDVVDLATYVSDIEADTVAAIVDSATSDADNAATQVADTQWEQIAGDVNCITIESVNGSSYDGLVDGDITEVYRVIVTKGSTGGDASSARLQVISASGHDDVTSVTPSGFGSPTVIGTRGLTVEWEAASSLSSLCSISAGEEDVPTNEFIEGQEWRVIVAQAFSAPTANSSSSSYTGTDNKTYIIEVTRGGLYADDPQITCRTNTGTDTSGPTSVTAASTAVEVGTEGVVVSFNQIGLRKGDRYYIDVEAAKPGAYKILVLGDDLDSSIPLNDAGGAQIDLSLYIKKNLQVTKNKTQSPPNVNWSQSDTEFCVESGIQAKDSSWTDSGVEQWLSVITDSVVDDSNQLYVEYRCWESSLADEVRSISDTGDLSEISGPLHPDNPLKWAIFKALQNANGQDVRYMAVADPDDSDSWVAVLDKIEDRDDVYGLVPLTRDSTVLGLFQAHADAQSTETIGRWRVLWLNVDADDTIVIADDSNSRDGEVLLATTADDTSTSGTQYTILTISSGNAKLVTLGVRAGDVARYQYTTDGFGGSSYSEYVVDAVLNENKVRLVTGTASAINVAEKVEFWRTRTADELSTAVASASGVWFNRHVRAVWPDTLSDGGTEMEGYHLCAGLAGLVSGVAPHQGLTRLAISGFDDLSRTFKLFNRTQLDRMAKAGTWIVTQDLHDGTVFTRHAVTTGADSDVNEREEIVTRNLDSISFYFLDKFSPYIGISNVTPGMLDIIEAEVRSGITFLQSANFSQRLGGQLIDASITDLRRSAQFKDRILVALSLTIPYALNVLEIHLLV